MDLLQRHLPRVFEALQSALDYLGAVANLVFGDAPPPSPDPDADSSTPPRAGDLTDNRKEVEVPSKSSPDITDSDLEKDSFSCIEVSTNTLDLSAQWSRVTLRRVSSSKRQCSGGPQHASISDASREEASPCLLTQLRGLGGSQSGGINEVCLEDSLPYPSSDSRISAGTQHRSIHKTCIENLTLGVGTQRRSAERQQPAGSGDGYLEEDSIPGASKGVSMSTFYYPIAELTSEWSPPSQGNENEEKDEEEEEEEEEALNLTGNLLKEIEEYLQAPMVPAWGVKESSFTEQEGANSMGEENDRLQGLKREEQPTCAKDQITEEKPICWRATTLGQEKWREERLIDEENEGRESHGTPTLAEQEEDREENREERPMGKANEDEEYLWRSNATLRMKDKEEKRKVSPKSKEEQENTEEDFQGRNTVTWKEGSREEQSVGEEKREKVPDEKAAETEQEEVMVVEREEEISRERESPESEEEHQDRPTFTWLQRGIEEDKTWRPMDEELEETEKTQWKVTARLLGQATERRFVENKEEKSHVGSTLTHQDDLTTERSMEEEDEEREEFQQKVTVTLQEQVRKERFVENVEKECDVGSTFTLQDKVRSERLMLEEKGVDECDSWLITTQHSDGRVVAREAESLGGKNKEEEPPQTSNFAMREQNMEGKAMDRLEQKTDEEEHSQRSCVTLEQGSEERDRKEINVDEEVRMIGLIVDHSRAFVTKQEPLTMTERKEKPTAIRFPEQENEDHLERRIIVQDLVEETNREQDKMPTDDEDCMKQVFYQELKEPMAKEECSRPMINLLQKRETEDPLIVSELLICSENPYLWETEIIQQEEEEKVAQINREVFQNGEGESMSVQEKNETKKEEDSFLNQSNNLEQYEQMEEEIMLKWNPELGRGMCGSCVKLHAPQQVRDEKKEPQREEGFLCEKTEQSDARELELFQKERGDSQYVKEEEPSQRETDQQEQEEQSQRIMSDKQDEERKTKRVPDYQQAKKGEKEEETSQMEQGDQQWKTRTFQKMTDNKEAAKQEETTPKEQGDIHYDGDDAASPREPDNLQEVELLLKKEEDVGAWVGNSWVKTDVFENVRGSLDDEMELSHKKRADPQHEGKEVLYPGEQDDHQEVDDITHHGSGYQQEYKWEELVGGNKETSQKELGGQQVKEEDEEGALFQKDLCELQLSKREEEEMTIHQKNSGDLQVKEEEEEEMSQKEHNDILLKEGVEEAFQMEQTEVPKDQGTPEWVPGDKQKEEMYIFLFQMEHGNLDRKKGVEKEKTSMMENRDLPEEGEENEEMGRTQGDMGDNQEAREMEEAKDTHREHSDQHMEEGTFQRDQVDLHKEQESGKDEASKMGDGDLQEGKSGKKEGTCQKEKGDQLDKEDIMSHKKSVTEKWRVEEETYIGEQVLEEERMEGDTSLGKPKSEEEGRKEGEKSLGEPVSVEGGLEGDESLGTPVSEEDTSVQWELFLRETISEKGIFEEETYVGALQSDKEEIEVGNKSVMEPVFEKLGGEEEDTCRAEPRSETERVEGETCLREFALKEVKLGEECSHSDGREDEKKFLGQLATIRSTEGEISLRELVPEEESVEKWTSLEEPIIDKWVEEKEISLGESVFVEVGIEEVASLIESASEEERIIDGEPSLGEPISKEVRDDPDATPGESLLEIDGSEGRETLLGEVVSEDEGGMVRKSLLGEFILENVGGMEELYLREPVSKEVQENPESSLGELILEKEEIDEGETFQRDPVSEEGGLEGKSSGGESVSEEEEEKGSVEEETSLRESVSPAKKKREEPLLESTYEKKRREAGKAFLEEPISGEERLVTKIFLGEPEHEGEAFLGERESDKDKGDDGDTSWEEPISERERVRGEPYSGESVSEKERVEVEQSHGGSVSGKDRRDERETFLGEPSSDGKMREETSQRETLLEDEREEGEIYLGELISEEVKIKKDTYLQKPVSQDWRVETEMILTMQELEEGKANVEPFQVELVLEDGRVKEKTYTREPVLEEGREEKKTSQRELVSDEGKVEEETSHMTSIPSEGREEGERSVGEVAKEEVTIVGDAVQRDPVCEYWRGETETSLKKEVSEDGRVDGEVYQVKPVTEGEGETYVKEPISDDRREEEEGQQETLVSDIEKMERSLEEPICKEWKVQEETSLGEPVLEDRRVGIETSEKITLLEELRVEGETSLGCPGSEEWRVEKGTYMREPESKEDRGGMRNMSLGELVLKQGRVEQEASLQGPSFEGWIVDGDTTLWETSLYDERVEDEMSLVEPVSEKGRVEEEASLGEPVQGSMKLETCIEGPVAEGSMEGEISVEESASEKEKVERETFLGSPVSEESRGVENLVMREPELEEGGLERERLLKQSCHPPKGEEEELCQSLYEPDLPPQELKKEVKTISVDQPYFKHQLVVEEMHRSPNKSEYLFQEDIWISTQEPPPGSVLEGDKSLNQATYPVCLETDTFSFAETVCLPLVQKGQIALNSHDEREEGVILSQESECPSDLVSEKYHMDKAKGQVIKDKSTPLEMQSDYSLEKRPLGQTDGPMQHQREKLMVLPTPHPRHFDIGEKTQVQEFITHPDKENAVQKLAFTKIRVLPPIIGTKKVDVSTQDFKEGDTFKREPHQQSVGKMEDTTSQSHEKEASEGQTVDTAVEKDKKKEDELDGLFNLEEVQTLDVSAQKSRIHLRRKVSVRHRQVPALWPRSDHDTSTEPKEPALPSLEPSSKMVADQPIPLPVHETHIKPAEWTGPGEGFPTPSTVLPKPWLIPGMVPIMMPGMVRTPHPQLIPGSSAKENLVTEGSMPAEVIAPKKKFPGHAGFGFAHPQMMQELQFRLRKPKPQ